MSSLGDNKALLVAECLMEYSRKKERQEQIRLEQYVEHTKQVVFAKKCMVFLMLSGALMITLCIGMISLAMQAKEKEERIAGLKIEVAELRKENQEAEKRAHGSVDYQWVRSEAERLGMSQATPDRVIFYSVEDVDYMIQYQDVP